MKDVITALQEWTATGERIQRLAAPIGLDLGATNPEETAPSIHEVGA